MFYEEVFRELNRAKVRYVVVGGVALVLHGVVRMTVDLDLFIDLEEINILKFGDAIQKIGYRPKKPVKFSDFADSRKRAEWIKEKGMKVFPLYHVKKHLERIDVFVYEPIKFRTVYSKKDVIRAEKIKVPVISIEHLKEFKEIAGRPQDICDIEALNQIKILRQNEKSK